MYEALNNIVYEKVFGSTKESEKDDGRKTDS
jgi:hypothetical protein